MPLITGNTYPVRVELRGLGGVWNKAMQGWDVPEDKAEEARAIVAAAPVTERRSSSRFGRRSGYTRFSGGGSTYRNPRGRCIDAPCCGCCD